MSRGRLPTVTVLTQLARVLGVPIGQLLGEQAEPPAPPAKAAAAEAIYRALTGPVPAPYEPPPLC